REEGERAGASPGDCGQSFGAEPGPSQPPFAPAAVDPNKERREAVKRKITQYLRRAEEIFNCHLQRAAGGGSTAATGYSSLRFRPIRTLSSAVENLRRCKVVGVIDKVQIVQDPATGETFILKSLPKSHVETRARQTIIPHGVPFMVKLLCYYVSEDSIFLHLEHVQGGTLWSHLRSQYGVQQDCADSNTIQALQHHGTEDAVWEPSWGASLTCGWLSKQPPSGQCRALASHGHSRRAWAVKEEQVQLWAAEILLALEGLHQQGVLCQDLNPRNLLLDTAGHVRLTFFGQWTEVEPQYCSQAREELYSAPEVGGIVEPTEAADCWSFGSLLYELLTGVVRG
ncbi:hypothetical protein EK904_009672, partial [Melospiza melodia maxima]